MSTDSTFITQDRFAGFFKDKLGRIGLPVTLLPEVPFADKAPAADTGSAWAFGAEYARDEFKGRVGVWFRRQLGPGELVPLLQHYRSELETQGIGVHIGGIATELGQFILCWDSVAPLPLNQQQEWTNLAERVNNALTGDDDFTGFLAPYRKAAAEAQAPMA